MSALTSALLLAGLSICPAVACTVNFEYLLGPKRATDRSLINSVKVSYATFVPDSICAEIERLVQTKGVPAEYDGCLNGLGHVAILKLSARRGKKIQTEEVVFTCDEFKSGAFVVGKKWFEISLPMGISEQLLKAQVETEAFQKRSLDSTSL
jgi:hypothetical protein